MPVVDVDPDELRRLTARPERSDEELQADLFALGLEFEGLTEDGDFELEFAPDRLDRLSVEGVARSLRYQYGEDRGVYLPATNDPEWTIEVDPSVPEGRPYVTGAVVRGLDLGEAELDSLIQLQEKLHATIGRGRAKGAIGVHDLAMLKGREADRREASEGPSGDERSEEPRGSEGSRDSDDPRGRAADTETPKSIVYRGIEPDGDTFVPLDDDAERTPGGVLAEHPAGDAYGDLVAGLDRYPAIYDDVGLFSFPPVINGARTEVDTGTRDLLVEMTGTDQWTIDRMLNIVCYALDARGGQLESVRVEYGDRTLDRPDLSTSTKTVAHDLIESTLGVTLPGEEVVDLLERSGLDATVEDDGGGGQGAGPSGAGSASGLSYEVEIPPYRVDVLHPLDVVDDVGRAYGFDDLEPRYPDVSTVGGRHDRSRLEDAVRDALVGLGFEDLLNFHLTSEAELFERMSLSPDADALGTGEPPTITEPYSEDYTVVRTWALPSLLMVLENNTHRAYPQDLADIGLVAAVDESEPTNVAEHRSVAGVVARTDASYEDAKGRLQALAGSFGAELETPPIDHPSFIDGRTATVELDGRAAGVLGEVHPRVLVEHDLEVPVAAFEFRLDALE